MNVHNAEITLTTGLWDGDACVAWNDQPAANSGVFKKRIKIGGQYSRPSISITGQLQHSKVIIESSRRSLQ